MLYQYALKLYLHSAYACPDSHAMPRFWFAGQVGVVSAKSGVQVLRQDWLRVARGLTSLEFWRSGLTTHPSYSWYLQRVKETVKEAMDTSGVQQVILVGHSAGGWLGRAFLGDGQWFVGQAHVEPDEWMPGPGISSPVPNPCVRAIVTLGTPQRPPPTGVHDPEQNPMLCTGE